MSGHSKWSKIKHKKTTADQKKSQVFSKLARDISITARDEPNPEFNSRLRAAIEKARTANMPNENIERAIQKAVEAKDIEKLVIEIYGPGGCAVIVNVVTNNRNRTISEIKHLLKEHGGKWAETGSVGWAFEKLAVYGWKPKFPQPIGEEDKNKLEKLINALEEHDAVEGVYTNVS